MTISSLFNCLISINMCQLYNDILMYQIIKSLDLDTKNILIPDANPCSLLNHPFLFLKCCIL